MEKRERAVSLNTIGTVLSVIAAMASAYFAFRANDLMEQQTRAAVDVNEKPNMSNIGAQVCFIPASESGVGLSAMHYYIYYSVKADVKLTNNGGKDVSVTGVSAVHPFLATSGMVHRFSGTVTDLQSSTYVAVDPAAFTVYLPMTKTQYWRLTGELRVLLGDTLEEAAVAMDREREWAPSSLDWVLTLGDTKTVQISIPAKMDENGSSTMLAVAPECKDIEK